MEVFWIRLCLFSFVLSVVTMVGYWFFLRPAEARLQEPAVVRPSHDSGKLPEVRGALVELFRSVGEKFPGANKQQNPYRKKLQTAGYRWPGAVAVFYGIKCASTLLLAGLFGITVIFCGNSFHLPLLPRFFGARVGFLLPDPVLEIRPRRRLRRPP